MKRLFATAAVSLMLGGAVAAAQPVGGAVDPNQPAPHGPPSSSEPAPDPTLPAGAPAPPAPIATQLQPRQYVIFFDRGEVGLPEAADALLPQIVEVYKRVHFARIAIECHTDKMKTPEKEVALATDRANRIKAILVLYGVSADAITAVGLPTAPLVPGKTPDVAISNRRCQIDLS